VTFYPTRRGYYQLYVYVCEEPENICNTTQIYKLLAISPQEIYLKTKYINKTQTQAYGSGLFYAIISRKEYFYVQLKDKYSNNFNVLNDTEHM
jgi:hypothetical protein